MARVLRLRFGLVALVAFACLVVSALSSAGLVHGNVYSDEGSAASACSDFVTNNPGAGYSCKFASNGGGVTGNVYCPDGGVSNSAYNVWQGGNIYGIDYHWCASTCTDTSPLGSPSQQWDGDLIAVGDICDDGCFYHFHPANGVAGVCFAGGTCSSFGYYQETGSLCSAPAASPPAPPVKPTKPCGGQSCYDPQHGYCAVTDSGEQICTGNEPPPSGCVAGATGAVCTNTTGGPPPSPPDPPVATGQPPTGTDTASQTNSDSTGQTSNSTTIINNYNGTDTSSGSGAGGGSPGSGSSTGVGGSSNTSGAGNSGSTGTDSTGKCPGGAVPTASGCSGTFSDANCDSPPACYGDAVLCGIGREDWATRCGVQKQYEFLSDKTGVPSATPDVPASSVIVDDEDTSTFDEGGLGWGRTCPANPSFVVLGKTFTVDLSGMCSLFSTAGIVVLIAAYLAALGIVAKV